MVGDFDMKKHNTHDFEDELRDFIQQQDEKFKDEINHFEKRYDDHARRKRNNRLKKKRLVRKLNSGEIQLIGVEVTRDPYQINKCLNKKSKKNNKKNKLRKKRSHKHARQLNVIELDLN